jgi:hypothetical protein
MPLLPAFQLTIRLPKRIGAPLDPAPFFLIHE